MTRQLFIPRACQSGSSSQSSVDQWTSWTDFGSRSAMSAPFISLKPLCCEAYMSEHISIAQPRARHQSLTRTTCSSSSSLRGTPSQRGHARPLLSLSRQRTSSPPV